MTTPYYQDHQVTLYCGDSREITDWATSADVLVTDPPYGVAYQSGHRTHQYAPIAGDRDTSLRDTLLTMWREHGPDRAALVFGQWQAPPPTGERARLTWAKGVGGMGDTRIPWYPDTEIIHVLGTTWDLATTGHKRESSVLNIKNKAAGSHGEASLYDHPTPKPADLMRHLINRCPPGTIADPCAGVGGTVIGAIRAGRRIIAVELEERYCETIVKRVTLETAPLF